LGSADAGPVFEGLQDMASYLENTIKKLQSGSAVTIVALGDSLTSGWMVARGYTEFLRDMLMSRFPRADVALINSGIPGDTAPGGLYRLQQDALSYRPDLVLVQFALNDAFCGCTVAEYRHAIEAIVERILQESSAEVLLLTSTLPEDPEEQTVVTPFYAALQDIAREKGCGVALVDELWRAAIVAGTPHDSLVLYDRVHPSEAGYRLMAEAVMACLRQGQLRQARV
jgi:acyl-CoA thioesterase-1